jgi:GT2 family glycosyltransferase
MSVGVVVTNYETWELTRRCISALEPFHHDLADCVIVDDGSRRPQGAAFPDWVRVLRNPTNLGLVPSLNAGLRALRADVAVIFDSDAYPLADFVSSVRARFAADPHLGVVGFRTVGCDGASTGSSEWEPGVRSLLLGQRLDAALPSRLRLHLCVYSCAMALRRTTFDQLNGFDERFDWLDLDLDLCARAWRTGWRVEQGEDLTAFHEGSGAPQATSARVERFHRNRWRLLRKLGKLRHPRIARSIIGLRTVLELSALISMGPLFARTRAVWLDKLAGRRAVLRWVLGGDVRTSND